MKLAKVIVAILVSFVAVAGAVVGVRAHADQPVPTLNARVTDETGTLSEAQKTALEETLKDFEAKKGAQIAVLLVPPTDPETIEQYAIRVVEQWKIGRKQVDDGVLLIVAKNDRTLRIEVGYGLEGVLTDATSRRIIDETIVPRFRQGDFYGGIFAGVENIMRVVSGEALPAPVERQSGSGGLGPLLPVLFLLTVAAGALLRALLGRLPGAALTGGLVGFVAWLLSGAILVAVAAGMMALGLTLAGGAMGAYAGGRYLGGGKFGDRSNRDIFRGGGGGFGGGGASGRW